MGWIWTFVEEEGGGMRCVRVSVRREGEGGEERTFLNSYRSVWFLYCHIPGTYFGCSNGSVGCQYSTNPASSAETTVSYRSLYCTVGFSVA